MPAWVILFTAAMGAGGVYLMSRHYSRHGDAHNRALAIAFMAFVSIMLIMVVLRPK